MMEICLFRARVILSNCIFPMGFPPYFRCGLYLNAGSTRPITVVLLLPLQCILENAKSVFWSDPWCSITAKRFDKTARM